MRFLPYIGVAIAVYATLFYIETYQPEVMTKFILQVDVFGMSRTANEEKQRIEQIRELSIPYEQKQVLINRTVFMGASTDMVKLALGAPMKMKQQPWQAKNVILTYYIYYLPNDKRPTILVFRDDRLIYAYEGSALEVGN